MLKNNSVKEKYHFFKFFKKHGYDRRVKMWTERCKFSFHNISHCYSRLSTKRAASKYNRDVTT